MGPGDGGKGDTKGKGRKGKGGKGPDAADGAQFMVAQPEGAEVDIGDLERMVAMLERVGDVASAAKHKCTLTERRRKAAEKAYVAPLSQRVTMAHKQAAEVSQKLEKAVAHFERLQEGFEQQRKWVQQLTDELEEREKEHCRLVVELKETYVPPQQAPAQALSVAGILDGTIETIPLSFAGQGFDDAEYDMEEADKRELEDRTARLQTELAAAVKAMFGQAAEKAKAFKVEQEQMAARLAGKRRRQDPEAAALGPEERVLETGSSSAQPESVARRPLRPRSRLDGASSLNKGVAADQLGPAARGGPPGSGPGTMGLPLPEPIDPDGPEAAFYDGVTMSAARWIPRLHSSESGADCWMQWCKPYVRELLMQVQHDHWVQEARQGRSLDQMAEDICAEAWEDGAENHVNILGFFDWCESNDRDMLRWALRRHWEELRRIKNEMGDLLSLP
ncbi:unnamed protein product, partial [Prorocentrum cordatum]